MKDTVPLRSLLIVGAGGSGREVAWLARDIYGENIELTFAVERSFRTVDQIDGIPVVTMESLPKDITYYVVAIGNIVVRRRISKNCDARGLVPISLIHPSVLRSSHVKIGAGSILCAGCIITTNIRIGRHVHVNIGCTLSHDVTVDDFSTLSPSVHLSGHVHVEQDVFIGTGANVINGSATHPVTLGRGAIVAAGACVTRSVDSDVMVAGVPATRKR